MASTNNDKYWSVGTLKSRSWTEALIAELLPKPQYRYFNGKRVRTWKREDVAEAEQTDRFTAEYPRDHGTDCHHHENRAEEDGW